MAKTTSQIIEENKVKRAEEAAIAASRDAIHQKQMAQIPNSAAKTAAILAGAVSGTTDAARKKELQRAVIDVTASATKKKNPTTAREEQISLKKAKETAKQKKDRTKYEYDQYTASDEYRQRLAENDQRNKQQEVTNLFLPPEMRQAPQVIQDDKEIRLRAAMEQAEQEFNAEEDRKLMEADMEAVTGLSNEDRQQLEQYAVNQIRDQNMPVEFQNMPFFKTAEQEASGLIGKVGKQRADELAETFMRQENEKLAQEVAAKGAEHAGTGFWQGAGASAATIPINIVAGLVGSVGQLQGAARNTGRYQTLDPNATGTALQTYTGAVRGQVQQNIEGEDPNLLRKAASIGYQGLMSAADSLAQAYLGGAVGGAALAATNSFSQTMAEASRNGATPAQAALLATATAGIEALSEKIPLDNLLDTAKGGKQTLMQAIDTALKQAGIEAATEEISLLGTVLAEAAILKENSGYQRSITAKILSGMAPEQAKMEALREIWNEAVNTAMVAAVSGAGSSAVSSAVANVQANERDTTPNAGTPEEIKQKALDKVRNTEAQKTAPEQQAASVAENETADKTEAVADKMSPTEVQTAATEVRPEQKPAQVSDIVADMVRGNTAKQNEQAAAEQAAAEQAVRDRAAEDMKNKQRHKDIRKELMSARAEQNRLQKEIANAERKLKETGKGSPARIEQLKVQLEQQNNLVTQIESQEAYFSQDYEKTVDQAKERQRAIYEDARQKAVQAIADHEAGIITDAQLKAANDAYNNAGAELYRLGQMTQADYQKELAQVGLVADSEVKQKPAQPKTAAETAQQEVAQEATETAKTETDTEAEPVETPVPTASDFKKRNGKNVAQNIDLYFESVIKANKANAERLKAAQATETQKRTQQTDTRTDVQQRATERVTKPTEVEQAGVNERTEPGIKVTGAAEQNFSGKAEYQNLLSEDNVQRDREGDVRPMEVPKTDSFGRRVSELVGNAYGAEITTDKMANTIEELVQEGALGFDVRHNQDSMNTAAEQIAQRGVAATKKQITNAVASGKIRDGDVEQAILLYAMYNSKDTPTAIDNASEILVDLATMANITGRNLQMFRLLRKMTPEGQVTTIRKTVQSNIDSMIKSGAVKKGYTTEIDPELLAEYRKAAGENMRAVSEEQKKASAEKMKTIMDAIYAMEAAKMPATMKAKWDAWRYMAMLGNAKTQVRNVAGNIAFTPYKTVKDKMGAAFEKMLPKEQRTKALVNDPELVRWADADAKSETVKDALKYSGKLGDDVAAEKMRDNMKVFDTKALEAVRKFVEKVPQAGDMAFKSKYYSHSLAGFLKARGYTVSDIQNGKVSDAILSEARSYAIQEAMKATFNDSNAFSDFMATGLRYKGDNPIGKALNTAAEGVLPFRRTPANIAVRFTEYSPVGMAKGVWDMATKVRKGEISAAAAVDQITAGMTGTAAMALGYFLANGIAGVKITGSGTGEDEKRQGHQDYALEWTDKDGQEYSYRIDWAAPANLPLFVGANINKLITDQGGDTSVSKFTSALHGIMTMFEPMLALSCLSSLNDLVEGIRYADEGEALYTAAADVATSYIMQGIPSLVRQTAQAKQEFKQTTFANSEDPTIRDMQSTAANIPFVGEKYQTEKVNVWGEKESTGTAGERIFNAFINPGTLKKIDNSALEKEISRLNKSQEENVAPSYIPKVISYTDKDGNKHNNHRMTEEEYQTLAQTQGQTAKSILESMISSKNYAAMTDDQRAKAMQQVYTYAREKAMQKAFPDHLGYSESWMQELREGKEAEYILRRVTNSELNRTMSNLTTAWDNKYSTGVTDSYSRELETAYNSYAEMDKNQKALVRSFATGTAAKYIEAREKGISHADFLKTAKAIKSIKPEAGSKEPNQKQQLETIARAGLSESQKVTMAKLYASDAQDKNIEEVKALGGDYKLYTELYRDHSDYTKGTGKKNRTINHWIQKYGMDYSTAKKYYEVFS